MNDEKIIKLYFDRSEDAITETDRKYGGACRSVAYNILGSREDTEECTNDTYMEVWEAIPPKRPAKLGAFVVSIARHLALNMYTASNRIKNGRGYSSVDFDEIAECLPAKESVESEIDDKTVLDAVERFLTTLSREKQIMFVRRYYYGSTYGEIADDLKTNEDRVRMTLKRIRENLRKFLEKEGIEI